MVKPARKAVKGQGRPVAGKAQHPESRRLLNRELSWLDFNERVLVFAGDRAVPLLERIKLCSIFSSNLDEFFMVRVAGLMGQSVSGTSVLSADGNTPLETLAAIRRRVLEMTEDLVKLWQSELLPDLLDSGIQIGKVGDCTADEVSHLETTFATELYPVLTPLAVGPSQPFPYISGLSLSLGLFVKDPVTSEERFARVKVPEGLPRFVQAGPRLLIPLEEVIEHFLGYLFPGIEINESATFRVTRDADLEVSDEADDLLEAVELELRRRRFGDVVRLEVSDNISNEMLERLRESLGVTADQIYRYPHPLDLADLIQIADMDRPQLRFQPWLPVTQTRLGSPLASDFFAQIRRGDLLVHFPYDSFTSSVEAFVRGAAKDPGVIGLKTTVYRTSNESPLVPALVDAAEDGKQSVCLVELTARFDERHNIEWSRRLERAGVHVVYGFPNLKIHAKTTLVVRREGKLLRRYVHIGTGNYNSSTARSYEDYGLFTADDEIAGDIAELFNFLTGFGKLGKLKQVLVAPFTLRQGLKDHIRNVAKAASDKKSARIRIKVNSLTDPELIEELYQASAAGAAVEILCRSICSLRPGVESMSKNIVVRSVLGRFLEHSRVFSFDAAGKKTVLIGSSDLMARNLDQRIEVVVPVKDPKVRQELENALEVMWADTAFAWQLQPDGNWQRLQKQKGRGRMGGSSQGALMRRARLRTARRKSKRQR